MQPNSKENKQAAPVMDIQRPSQTISPSSNTPSSINTKPATMEYTRPRTTNGGGMNQTQNTSFYPQPDMSFSPIDKPKKSKSGLVLVAIVVSFFVIFGGVGTYYYFAVENKKPAVKENQQVASEPSESEATDKKAVEATPEGVDSASTSIVKQINSLDDALDYSASDIGDSNLGL